MPRIRTFIAIDVDDALRDRLVALQETLARAGSEVKWVEPDNLHLTLLFLGEVEMKEVHAVCRAVADTCREHHVFPLTVERVGGFPNARRPRVLWAGVGEGAEDVVALHDALEPPLLDLGYYRREERHYTPHVTLGRVPNDGSADRLALAVEQQAQWRGGQQLVKQVLVMSSELTSNGPLYTVLSRAKLAIDSAG
jgi:2'-5' RNA ligase